MEYEIEFELMTEAKLRILIFGQKEHRWIFSHRYVSQEDRKMTEEPQLVNDTTLTINYDQGLAQKIDLMMNITRPNKRGKKYFAGVDIPKGSKIFVEIYYEKQDELFRMSQMRIGNKILDLQENKEGIIKPVEFPFPLVDRVKNEYGTYSIPFLKNDGQQSFFEFPENYQRSL